MVYVTIDLVRKRAEHHDKQLAPLQEISLHQESIEKIEFIQDWCPKLQILLLQSNLISKIENLNKLKGLEYLNLAINNIEKIENLERCESLQKLDLTLNFIGELSSLESLKYNYNLKHLFMNGNPCTDYKGYKEYTICILPQLEVLDNNKIKRSERMAAFQTLDQIERDILTQQKKYTTKRESQKIRLAKEHREKLANIDETIDDEERTKRFWSEKSEHCPETRIEMDHQTQIKKNINKPPEKLEKRRRQMFAPDGRAYNINEPHIPFVFSDERLHEYCLDISVYKYLDTSFIDVDVQPLYVRVTIKTKIFQICLPEEINTSESTARRSKITGHLVITMPKLQNGIIDNDIQRKQIVTKTTTGNSKNSEFIAERCNDGRREFLEIGSSCEILDFTRFTSTKEKTAHLQSIFPKEKLPSSEFIDNFDVPPLM